MQDNLRRHVSLRGKPCPLGDVGVSAVYVLTLLTLKI